MAISDRTRKTLWGTAGGLCSICRTALVTEATATDNRSVLGEEAHIVGQSPTGPRAGPVADIDGYDNLILLCSNDHKQVDDQVGYYTVERLRQIKSEHEARVRSRVKQATPGEEWPGRPSSQFPRIQPAGVLAAVPAFFISFSLDELFFWIAVVAIVFFFVGFAFHKRLTA